MLTAQRRDLLLQRLGEDGHLVAKDLARELGTSEDTIRRDLRELSAAGRLQRVYGGAIPASPAAADYATRQAVAVDSKQRVARACLELIRPASTVILDGGTTALAVAQLLPARELTVVTHSPTVAIALVENPAVDVFLLGGRLFKHSVVTSGAAAAEAAAGVSADLFLLGVTGVHPEAGLTTGDADEAAMKRTLSHRAAETWVMASAEKVGAASAFSVLPLDGVAGVVTDAGRDDATVAALQRDGVAVLTAAAAG